MNKTTNTMSLNRQKKKHQPLLTLAVAMILALFTQVAQAQTSEVLKMTNGTKQVPTNGLLFYDSGGPLLFDPAVDPVNANEYNWTTWYQHNEGYTLTLTVPEGNGIKVEFSKLLVNNDHLSFYEGDVVDETKLIGSFTNNDYSTNYSTFAVVSHGNMTIRFESDGQWRDEGWEAVITRTAQFQPLAPVAMMASCNNLMSLIPTSLGNSSTLLQYKVGSGEYQDYTAGALVDLNDQTYPLTVTVKAIVDETVSAEKTYSFNNKITPPAVPTYVHSEDVNIVTVYFPVKPAGVNDTYNIRWMIDNNETASEPNLWPQAGHEFQQPRNTPNTVPAGNINYTNVTLSLPFYIHFATRGTTCPDDFSEVVTVKVTERHVPAPTIAFETSDTNEGLTALSCSLDGATIYYTTDGTTPTTASNVYSAVFTVRPGTTVKAISVKDGYSTSAVASAIFIPDGESGSGQSGAYGDIVLLDDREDHTWSYYSDGNQPIHSLNPADVKITYYGNGTNTVATSNNANPGNTFTASTNNSVQVSYNETESTFIYLKTLERADGATSQNPSGNCAYTTIPNPFSKRPTYGTGDTRWRGFYGWRVKSVSGGSIQNYAVGATIPAETEIQFVPAGEYGMEVELEALWARAYVVDGNNSTYVTITKQNVGFERNFVILRGNNDYRYGRLTNTEYPVTVTAIFPNGTSNGTTQATQVPTTARFRSGFECDADIKIEYIRLNNNNNNTLTANGHNLIIGRGVTGYNNGICATSVYGKNGTGTTINSFNLRVESGSFTNSYLFNGNSTVTSAFTVNATYGNDYDRAKNTNTNLTIAGPVEVAVNTKCSNANSMVNMKTLSGTFGANADNNELYMGFENLDTTNSRTYRSLEVLGGNFLGGISGGIEYGIANTTEILKIRIKGGTIHRYLYGSGQYASAVGTRKMIITGGTFDAWVAGGCFGTDSNNQAGITDGDSYIYFGGDATMTNTEGVFGGGYGRGDAGDNKYTINKSFVVVADEAQIAGNVYGGGNKGYNTDDAEVYVLGGGKNTLNVVGSVFGGANQARSEAKTTVTMKNGTVAGSLYAGANSSGTVAGLGTVNISGGSVTNVFGGGLGASTNMAAGTAVNVSGGTINNNVYGGGQEGTVNIAAHVNVSGGTMKDVFGAGKGGTTDATINGQTFVNVSGGNIDNVYGGGENGSIQSTQQNVAASTVTIQGGTVNYEVFGGGRLGKTTGDVIVNMFGGNINGNVYGGAFGKREEVFIAGTHTVNITGGNVYENVYAGSRNADDALSFDHTGYEMSQAVNRVNISGGHIYQNVFAGGYFGHTYGSVYAFIGTNAIQNAPDAAPTAGISYNAAALLIDQSVWAGADFGNFDGNEFGAETIEGYSNVYIDGTGYNTESTQPSDAGYMNIGNSIFGSGTSCKAGKLGNNLIIRNYGQTVENPDYNSKDAIVEPYSTVTRNLMSIQFFSDIVIDNTHIHFIGQGRINSLLNTEKVALYEAKNIVRIANGSSLFVDFPMDQVKKLGSYSCSDVYAATPSYSVVGYANLGSTDNKFRVNHGAFLNVKYIGAYGNGKDYGEVEGFFYMMTDDENNTCAYARPKQSTDEGNQINNSYDNPNDGGFLSYNASYNTFNISGGTATPGVQMPYENHTLGTKNGEEYFRIWRYGGIFSYRQGVFNAVASTTEGFSTTDVVIALPASRGDGSYFRIKTENGFPMIDYGDDVMTVNAGVYNSTNGIPASDGWMYHGTNGFVSGQTADATNTATDGLTLIGNNPNVNFGLVAIPQGSLNNGENGNWLICESDSDENGLLATSKWTNYDQTINPSILFRLTYNNKLSNNTTWAPIIITLEQCDADGHVKDEIQVALSIDISTTIDQDFSAQTYAVMNEKGTPIDTYTAKVVMPGFIPYVNNEGDLSDWTFKSAVWEPTTGFTNDAWQQGSGYVGYNNRFSLQIKPSTNFDNTLGWYSYDHEAKDLKNLVANTHLAYTDGRNPAAFDFILHFDGTQSCTDKQKMGELKVTLHFTNLASSTAPDHGKDMVIVVEVWRRGQGSNYYIDGVNGDNFYDGDRPDAAKKTLSGIYNRSDYLPGDNIFVVNTVTANSASSLDWNGELYGGVTIYRYPGGHQLKKDEEGITDDKYFTGYSETYNPDNVGFAGTLVKVERGMTMHGIVLDGAYDIAVGHPNTALVPDATKYRVPTAPLVSIDANAELTVYAASTLRHNYTNSNGGAVYNAGTMIIRDGSNIVNNAVLADNFNGAGVYMKDGATLIVSDSIKINNNHRSVNRVDKNNNVYLESAKSVIQVGTTNPSDGINVLEKSAQIGVTKGDWGDYYYTPIAYSDGGGSSYLGNIIPADVESAEATDYLIFDDDEYFHLVTLNSTPSYEPSSDYLFWVGTWVTAVRTEPEGFAPNNINSAEDLAWAISVVNGLNGVEPAVPDQDFMVTADIDMSARVWEPMGTLAAPYTGTFNGNGHVVKGVRSPLNEENMGMFGRLNGTVENMVLNVNFTGGNSVNMGSVAGQMNGGSISNVETAGVIDGTMSTVNMGGIVGLVGSGVIHSSFGVNTLKAQNQETVVGGLVGANHGSLFNSYSNVIFSNDNMANTVGCLVGYNYDTVENCYAVRQNDQIPAFAYANDGQINYCYFNKDINEELNQVNYQPTGNGMLSYPGYYAMVPKTGTYGYMYYDNIVHDIDNNNTYVPAELNYDNNQIDTWPGLLSVLNQWVKDNSSSDMAYTSWLRPTTKDINSDLPVLCFPMDNCLGTTDGRYLSYGAFNTENNGLDNLLSQYENSTGYIFLYDDAKNVTKVPTANVNVFINEDAVLLQANDAGDFINANVGVSFDNSYKSANDYWGNTLAYDWHFLSTPLANAPLGLSWSDGQVNWWDTENWDDAVGQVTGVSNSYLPDGTDHVGNWDFYSYYEPQYHWINFKRNSQSHAHYDEPHDWISYTNETELVPGKGYMAAIDKDSYLGNKGTLNGPAKTVSIDLTCSGTLPEVDDPTKDWGFNLLGNPYQAYLNMNNFLSANGLSSYWVYIAEQNKYVAGNVSASDNPNLPSATLHPHQAFFVRTTADKTVNFTYDMATADANAYSYFRDVKVNYPLVNLFAVNADGQRDLAVIEFNRPNMGGSKKLNVLDNADFALSAHMGGDYSILFTEEGTDRVPVHFTTRNDSQFTLTWNTMHGHFTGLFLVDNKTGVRTDMLHNDHYTFNATTDDYASRFYITFRVNGVDDHTMGDGEEFAFFDGSEWVVDGQGQLDVIDVTGRVLQSQQLSGETSRILLNNYAAGVYVLRITNTMTTKSQKIIIK